MWNTLRPWWVVGALLAGLGSGAAVRPAFTAPEAVTCAPEGGPFAHVPFSHPAYGTVDFLGREAGLFTGYPVDTFTGKRPLERYEFAVTVQRMVGGIQRAAASPAQRASPPGPGSGPGPRYDERKLRETMSDPRRVVQAVGWLRALVTEFEPELAMLGADTDQLARNLDVLEKRTRGALKGPDPVKPG